MWRVLSVFENFRGFLLKVLLRSTGLWDSIRYSCKLSFFHSSLVHSHCHPLQFFFRNSNNLRIRLETPRYYRRNRRWSFVYKPTISIFCRIGKGHFSHFSSHFLLSLVLFYPVQIALQARSPTPSSPPPCPHPVLVHQTTLGDLFFNDLSRIIWLETEIFTTHFGLKDLKEQGESIYQVKNNGEEKPEVTLPR